MQHKALQIQVELDVHAVTCPGVYLCPNGKVSLQLYMLDSSIQTICCAPAFPIVCHEKFIFYKMFYQAQRLYDLQKLLNKECLYIELIQWQNTEVGNVLATFQTNLNELLYPTTVENSIAGIDVDLLMEPERSFPGVIAPKIEVSTKTVIEDVILDTSNDFVVNPKVIQSKFTHKRDNPVHMKRVCHSTGYHRSRKNFLQGRKQPKPPFIVRKVNEDLLGRTPTGLMPISRQKCNCLLRRNRYDNNHNQMEKLPKIRGSERGKSKQTPKRSCFCGDEHEEFCPVCVKYKNYFENSSEAQYPLSTTNKKSCCILQTKQPEKWCACKEIANKRASRVIRCTSSKEREPEVSCFCTPNVSNLAAKLHRRLNQTLECDRGARLLSLPQTPVSLSGSEISCVCPDLRISDFYKDLYGKSKSKMNFNKYATPCCT